MSAPLDLTTDELAAVKARARDVSLRRGPYLDEAVALVDNAMPALVAEVERLRGHAERVEAVRQKWVGERQPAVLVVSDLTAALREGK